MLVEVKTPTGSHLNLFLTTISCKFSFNVIRSATYTTTPTKITNLELKVVDLRSDTITLPTENMRRAMASAVVGDDVFREDPTVNELETMAAKLFGMEAALFVPSGTMGNLICVLAHCDRRASEALLGDKSHIYFYEQGGIAQLGGVHPRTVQTRPDGTFSLSELKSKISLASRRDVHFPITNVICIENTHNVCGGKVLPLSFTDELAAVAKEYDNIPIHCDGARLYNAAVALKQPVSRLLQGISSVSMCLSKALSAPVGSLVGGSAEFIWLARRLRKVLGGGMRQAGVVAAAGIVALEEMPSQLSLDHKRAKYLAQHICDLQSPLFQCSDPKSVHSNIIMINLPNARMPPQEFAKRLCTVTDDELRELGKVGCAYVKLLVLGEQTARIVLHNNISQEDVELVSRKLSYMASKANG